MPRKYSIKLIGIVGLCVFLCGTSVYIPRGICDLAGNNAGQLRSVLWHYSLHPRKYLAARFLIDNMWHGYTESSKGIAYREAVLDSDAHTVAELNAVWFALNDSLATGSDKMRRVRDASIVSSEYLIDTLDTTLGKTGRDTF